MAGPTVRRLQLGTELERLRVTAGVSRADAAAAIGCSEARIGHIETGRKRAQQVRGECVEVTHLDGDRAVRHSTDPTGPMLKFTTAAWSAFTTGIRTGEFG